VALDGSGASDAFAGQLALVRAMRTPVSEGRDSGGAIILAVEKV
jgi:hypothetical protein